MGGGFGLPPVVELLFHPGRSGGLRRRHQDQVLGGPQRILDRGPERRVCAQAGRVAKHPQGAQAEWPFGEPMERPL